VRTSHSSPPSLPTRGLPTGQRSEAALREATTIWQSFGLLPMVWATLAALADAALDGPSPSSTRLEDAVERALRDD